MIAVVPIAKGELLSTEFLLGVSSQSVPLSLAVFSGEACSNPNERESAINVNRSSAQKALGTLADEYILLLDSDVILDDTDVVGGMLEFLNSNPSLDYCVVDTKGRPEPEHLTAALCLIRTKAWREVDYSGGLCQCGKLFQRFSGAYTFGAAHEFPEGRKSYTNNPKQGEIMLHVTITPASESWPRA